MLAILLDRAMSLLDSLRERDQPYLSLLQVGSAIQGRSWGQAAQVTGNSMGTGYRGTAG